MPIRRKTLAKRAILKEVYQANLEDRVVRCARLPSSEASDETQTPKRPSPPSLFVLLLLLFPIIGVTAYALYPPQRIQDADSSRLGFVRASVEALINTDDAFWGADEPVTQALQEPPRFEPQIPWAEVNQTAAPNYLTLMDSRQTSIADLFGLGVKTIVIDPGHGGRDPGAVGASGLTEKEVTLDVARRLRDRLLRREGYRVLLTRANDAALSLRERVEFANHNGADLFISLHVNALPVPEPTIVETYYFGPQSDERARRAAQIENRGSEYLMGDFRSMITKIGDSFKQQESRKLAAAIQRNLFRNIKTHENKRAVSWGIKTAPFVVLLGVDMPSVLAEVTTLSNKREERKLATAGYRDKIAAYLAQGVVEYLEKIKSNQGPLIGVKKNGSNRDES